ncbi:MAG: beta-ketoacyl-[acyl-carrier-protein] synthase family protein, partial [Chlamydiota bacterium]
NPVGLSGFSTIKALSVRNDSPQTASRPWDKERDGFVIGEGAAVLILEEYEYAKKRGATILAEVLGGGFSCDAYHITEPHPEGNGLILAFEKTLADAGITKERVNYINAHATSTSVGDVAEIHGIKKYFGEHSKNITVNATKSMIGHSLGAAGAIEAVVIIKALQTGLIHPTANLVHPEECLAPLDPVIGKAKKLDVDVALSNSFGFGGHNSCVAFSHVR